MIVNSYFTFFFFKGNQRYFSPQWNNSGLLLNKSYCLSDILCNYITEGHWGFIVMENKVVLNRLARVTSKFKSEDFMNLVDFGAIRIFRTERDTSAKLNIHTVTETMIQRCCFFFAPFCFKRGDTSCFVHRLHVWNEHKIMDKRQGWGKVWFSRTDTHTKDTLKDELYNI